MAAIKLKIRKRMAQDILYTVVVLHVIHKLGHCQSTVETSGQAFVQTDKELRYMDSRIHSPISSNSKDLRWDDSSTNPVIFEPPLLDFEEQPVGMPFLQQVLVQNSDTQNSLHLLSISGSTSHFHCSFFQEKHVPPGGNTTFEVVFLARRVGNVENTLYIHTSVGTFKYQVFGVGIANPYRVRPLLGAKVALNTTFSSLIVLHNPHSSTLQVQEVYTSGGDLHLQLPTGELEATPHFWEIPPYDSKPIIKADFLGRIENNHTAFIRIKTNKDERDNILVLPVEVEVDADPGIFSTLDKLDFGVVRSSDSPKTIDLHLYSSAVYPIPIHYVFATPSNDAIQIEFQPTYLKPDLWESTFIARISFNASRVKHRGHTSGHIVIKSRTENHHHVIPYQATVLHGSIFYDKNKTTFFTGQANRTISRNLPITNLFNFSLAIHNITIADDKAAYFTIDKFQGPLVIRKGDTKVPLLLHFHMNESNLSFKTQLCLHTNASTFYLPINVYNGRLKAIHHRPELFRGQLDFGTLNIDTEYSMLLTLRNENPVNVIIREYAANLDRSHVELLGVEPGNGTMLTRYHNTSLIPSPLSLPPNHFAVFNISIFSRTYQGTFAGECIFYTQFENLYVPITLRTAEGSLRIQPEKIILDNCFPGKPCRQKISMDNFFETYMALRDITFQPNDTRFYFTPAYETEILFEPGKNIYIGSIAFDPMHGASGCISDCYLGLSTYIPAGHHWLQCMELEIETPDVDQYLYMRARQKWKAIRNEQVDVMNVTVKLDTDQMRGFLFHAQAHLTWPSIVRQSRLSFPLTQIGNTSVQNLTLVNPSDVPVIVQVLPLIYYPNPQTILNTMDCNIADLDSIIESSNSFVFSVEDLQKYHPNYNFTKRQRRRVEKIYNIKSHPDSLVLTLNASSSINIQIGFTPNDDLHKASVLVIRNNLTIIETVLMEGSGGRGDMRFGNKKIGSTLIFEVTEKNCDRKKSSKGIPNFSVKNKFTARNTGQLPFFIKSFSVNDQECEGYGFKILECEGFELAPNASKTINIAFTPDFSMSRIQRVLTLHTSLGPAINYTLHATVPPHLLTKCSAALPRPSWEPLLYYSIVCLMGFVLFCIFAAAYFEAERIHTAEIQRRKRAAHAAAILEAQNGVIDRSKIFDLNNLNNEKNLLANGSASPTMRNGVVGGSHRGEDLTHNNYHNTAEQRYVETITPVNTRPTTARKRRGGGGGSDHSHHTVFFSHVYKAIINYMKVPLKFSMSFIKSIRSGSPNNNGSSSSKSEKESKSNNASTAKSSDNKEKADYHLLATQTILRRQSSSDRDEENNSRPSSGGRKRISNKVTKQQMPDLIQGVVNQDNKNKSRQHYESSKKSKGTERNNSKTIDRYVGMGLEPMESRSHNSTPEFDEVETRGKRNKKLRRDSSYNDGRSLTENEETSSTTTESSIEVDDKASVHDSTPEPVPSSKNSKRARGSKAKKRENGSDPNSQMDDLHGDDYIIGSRNKVHKKIHGEFGGNILRPSSLELPYKMEGDSPKPGSVKTADLSPHASVGRRAAKNRNKKNDLTEIALQTQMFQKAARGGGLLNDQLTNSSRSSSYSSVVSSGSDKANGNKISAFSPVNVDSKAPGAMTTGISMSPNSNGQKSAWFGSGVAQESQLSPGNSFGLEPIKETLPMASGFGSNVETMFNLSPGSIQSQQRRQATIMQQLQAERRQRQMEHDQRLMQDKWPFFDTVMPSENIWNTTAAPGEWAAPGSGAPSSSTDNTPNVWNPTLMAPNPLASSASGWGSMGTGAGSIWSNPMTTMTSNDVSDISQQAAFSPFNNLWDPSAINMPSAASPSSPWPSFSPPKPDEN